MFYLKKHIDSRPLFKGHNFNERLNYLINVREKYYKLSHVITKVDNNSVSEIVDNILKSLENRTLNDKSLSRS